MSQPNDVAGMPIVNRLLAALPSEEYQRLHPHLEPIDLKLRQILYGAGERASHAYFPHQSIVSLVSVMKDGRRVEVGLVGNEGMLSTETFMGGNGSPNEAMVQLADSGVRMETEILLKEFKRGGLLQVILLRYAQSLFAQVSQCAACNRLHSIEKRLARWLLMVSDRTKTAKVPMTQEFLAFMLGSERSGVTLAAITLQEAGVIDYRRGKISIVDREGLIGAACECYLIIKNTFDHFLDDIQPRDSE
jgi:CRP-like cAMP-binding protein